MNLTKEQERKRFMAIVLMLIIMLMCLILMLTSFTMENNLDRIFGDSGTPVEPEHHPGGNLPAEAIFTIVSSRKIDFFVPASALTKESVHDNEYLDIYSDVESSHLSLRSKKDVTSCKYDVVFQVVSNTFENKYISANGLRELDNQLILYLDGYKEHSATIAKSYFIDVNKIENNKFVIKDISISNDAKTNASTEHSWNIGMIFRNYRDYNQTNNAGKQAKATIHYEITSCQRIKNSY